MLLTIRIRGLQRQPTHQKISYKENSPVLEISDTTVGCERDGSDSFSCGVILMITFQLAFRLFFFFFSFFHECSLMLL